MERPVYTCIFDEKGAAQWGGVIESLERTISGESRGLLGNFSRQPNASVDFSADHKTEISQGVVVRSAVYLGDHRAPISSLLSRVNPSALSIWDQSP